MPVLSRKSNGHLARKPNGHLLLYAPARWYRVNLSYLGVFFKYKVDDYSSLLPVVDYVDPPETFTDDPARYHANQVACDSEFAALTSLASGSETYKECFVGSLSQYGGRGAGAFRSSSICKFSSLTPVDSPITDNVTGSLRTSWGVLRNRNVVECRANIAGGVTGWKNSNANGTDSLDGTNTGLSFGINVGSFSDAQGCVANFSVSTSGTGGNNLLMSQSGTDAIKALMTTDDITACAIKVGVGISGSMATYFGEPEYYGGPDDPYFIITTGQFSIRQTVSMTGLWIKI